MDETKTTHKHILKSTALFAGVQGVSIIVSIIRTKIVTILLGANGFGILTLFTSTLKIITDSTIIGLDKSAVKQISEYHSNEDTKTTSDFISTFNKLIWFTGVLGSLTTLLLSKRLSIWTFGNESYTYAFIWLSISILFSQLASGKSAILQGTRKLKTLAKAQVLGNIIGLLVSIPLYYFYKIEGIVPTIIISMAISYFIFHFFKENNRPVSIKLNIIELFSKSKEMLTLGATLSFTSLLTALSLWASQIYIRQNGGLNDVGLYNAGLLILNSYAGMLFNAMGTDYFPRLSAIHKNNNLITKAVNNQAYIAVLLITPVITTLITFTPTIVRILYTEEFLDIKKLIIFGIIGTLFKAISFSLGYVIIAKGDSKVFIKTSVIFNLILFLTTILSYKFAGLTGVGIGLIFYYLFHFIVIKIITKKLYSITLNKPIMNLMAISTLICALSLFVTYIGNFHLRIFILVLIMTFSIGFSLYKLQKIIDVREAIHNFVKKIK